MKSLEARRFLILAAVSASLGGCTTLRGIDNGYGDALAFIEPNPREAKLVRKLSMQELRWAPRGWREYEMWKEGHILFCACTRKSLKARRLNLVPSSVWRPKPTGKRDKKERGTHTLFPRKKEGHILFFAAEALEGSPA